MGWFGKAAGAVLGGPIGFFAGNELDKKHEADMAREGFDPYSGMPTKPQYIGMEPEALKLGGRAESMYGNVGNDQRALNQYTNMALRPGRSAGAMLAQKDQRVLGAQAIGQGRAQAAGEAAGARTAMASKGGLGIGAGERIGRQATNRAIDFSQAANQNMAQQNRLIGMEDANARMGQLGTAANMGLNQGRFDLSKTQGVLGTYEGDINRQTAELGRRNQFAQDTYGQQMGAWGAGKQADALKLAGKGGIFG